MAAKKAKSKSGLQNYNRALKQAAAHNNKLPEKRQKSYQQLQKIASKANSKLKDQPGRITKSIIDNAVISSFPKQSKGQRDYHRLVRQIGVINEALPEERQFTYQERKQIASKLYKDKLKGKKSRFTNAEIEKLSIDEIKKTPPKQLCDVNYIDTSLYEGIPWWDIHDHIQNVMPDCIYVKVDAGGSGQTVIFNTKNFKKFSTSIKRITENVRLKIQSNIRLKKINSESEPIYAGFVKLRPKKKNDGTPQNYYLEYILILAGKPVADTTETRVEVPKNKVINKIKDDISDIISDKMAKLKVKKSKERNAKKTRQKNINETQKAKNWINKNLKNPEVRAQRFIDYEKKYSKLLNILEKQKAKGFISEAEFKKEIKKINKYKDGGIA